MTDLRVAHVDIDVDTDGTDLTITLRPGHQGHRTSPDDLPAPVRRALLRWLGHIPETEATRADT